MKVMKYPVALTRTEEGYSVSCPAGRQAEFKGSRDPSLARAQSLTSVKAFEKAGFYIASQGKNIVMTDGVRIVTIPRYDPVDAVTTGAIVRDAGLSPHQFRELL